MASGYDVDHIHQTGDRPDPSKCVLPQLPPATSLLPSPTALYMVTMPCRLALLILCSALLAAGEAAPPPDDDTIRRERRGGVCFRFDDNHTEGEWRALMAVFARHRAPFCAALNVGMLPEGYARLILDLQAAGHEVMDHTPLHDTAVIPAMTGAGAAGPGIHHADGRRIHLAYQPPPARPTVAARLGGSTLTLTATPEPDRLKAWRGSGVAVHVADPADTGLVLRVAALPDAGGGPPAFRVRSAWGEAVDLGPERAVEVAFHDQRSLRLEPEAVALLARCSLERFAALGAQRPLTWIQPGGDVLSLLDPVQCATVLGGRFGYVSAACYIDSARKSWDEPDPRGDRAFAMMWGDFDLDREDAARARERIAAGIAGRRVLIGSSHLGRAQGGWDGLLARIDAVVGWCAAERIPIRTQAQWARLLYGRADRQPPSQESP